MKKKSSVAPDFRFNDTQEISHRRSSSIFLLRPVSKRLPVRKMTRVFNRQKALSSFRTTSSAGVGASLKLSEFIKVSAHLPDSYNSNMGKSVHSALTVKSVRSIRKKELRKIEAIEKRGKSRRYKGKMQTIDEAIEKAINAKDLGNTKKEGIAFFTFVIQHVCLHFQFLKKKADDEVRQFRMASIVFFEMIDMATNITSVVFYFLQSKFLFGYILLSSSILNRFLQGCLSCFYGESIWSNIQCFFGIKILSDQWTISEKGPDYRESSCENTVGEMKAMRTMTSLICESFSQMIVHFVAFNLGITDPGILIMQVLSVGSTVLTIGIVAADYTFQIHVDLKKEDEEIYSSMSAHVPQGYNSNARQNTLYLVMVLWYTIHSFAVSFGVSVLFTHAVLYMSLGVAFVYWLIFNLLRYFINGELRFFKRTSTADRSSMLDFFQIIMLSIVYPIFGGIVPTTVLRYQNLLGPAVWSFGFISSFLIATISIFVIVKDLYIIGLFAGLIVIYVFVIVIFLMNIEKEARSNFFWSTVNWKDTLREEIWNTYLHGSSYWNQPSLIGNEDAHYAGLIVMYLQEDLPWIKLLDWLKRKKQDFSNYPPIWLSAKWIEYIPSKVRKKVWTDDEFKTLVKKLEHMESEWNKSQIAKALKKVSNVRKDVEEVDVEARRRWLGDEETISAEKENEKDDSWAPKSFMEEQEERKKRLSQKPTNMVSFSKIQGAQEALLENQSNAAKTTKEIQDGHAAKKTKEIQDGQAAKQKQEIQDEHKTEEIQDRHTLQEYLLNRQRRDSVASIESLFINDDAAPRKIDDRTYFTEDLDENYRKKHNIAREKFAKLFEDATITNDIELITTNFFGEEGIDIGDSRKDALLFMSVLLKSVAHCEREFEEKRYANSGVVRVLISGFSEVADEVTDIVLGILFFFDSNNLVWAGQIMVGCFFGNRIATALACRFLFKEQMQSCVEALVGVKAITDTYRLATKGKDVYVKGSTTPLCTSQLTRISIGLITESIPQMILQLTIFLKFMKEGNEISSGILIAQIASVVSSCSAVGLSMASVACDMHTRHYNDGNEMYPDIGSFYPPKEFPLRYSLVFMCTVIWYSLHMFIVAFSTSTLFAHTSSLVSLSILAGYIVIFNLVKMSTERRCFNMYYKKMNMTAQRIYFAFFFFAYPMLNLFVPTTAFRYHVTSGINAWVFGCLSGYFSVAIIFIYVKDISFLIFFGCITVVYAIVVMTFLLNIKSEYIHTFMFTTKSWSDIMNGVMWNVLDANSVKWNVASLVGDQDASRAYMVLKYEPSYLDWDQVTEWLLEIKEGYLLPDLPEEDLPLWLSSKWLNSLPNHVKKNVWKEGELEKLIEVVNVAAENSQQCDADLH